MKAKGGSLDIKGPVLYLVLGSLVWILNSRAALSKKNSENGMFSPLFTACWKNWGLISIAMHMPLKVKKGSAEQEVEDQHFQFWEVEHRLLFDWGLIEFILVALQEKHCQAYRLIMFLPFD